MKRPERIPEPTIERLVRYSRPLARLLAGGVVVVSSENLAEMCAVNPAQVRKDLAFFGEFGVRGVGYDVRDLLENIRKILDSDRVWRLCIVGVGNLGRALLQNEGFRRQGYRFEAAFDQDKGRVGLPVAGDLTVEPVERMEEIVRERRIEIGVVTAKPDRAQRAADLLMRAGVRGVLNFAPAHIRDRDCCIIENVDFSVKLENLAYHLSKLK